MGTKRRMRIGELSRLADCKVETVRYYESEGLLGAAARSAGNYRLYDENDLERLAFIRRCRSLDMTLEEVRALLGFRDAPDADCAGANALLDEHIEHVGRRVEELRALRKQLSALRALCGRSSAARECAILHELASSPAPRGRKGHIPGTHRALQNVANASAPWPGSSSRR